MQQAVVSLINRGCFCYIQPSWPYLFTILQYYALIHCNLKAISSGYRTSYLIDTTAVLALATSCAAYQYKHCVENTLFFTNCKIQTILDCFYSSVFYTSWTWIIDAEGCGVYLCNLILAHSHLLSPPTFLVVLSTFLHILLTLHIVFLNLLLVLMTLPIAILTLLRPS